MNKSPDCLQQWFSTLSNLCCCCRCCFRRRKILDQSHKVCVSIELWPCIVDRLSNKCRQNCFSWNRTDHSSVSMNLDHSDLFSAVMQKYAFIQHEIYHYGGAKLTKNKPYISRTHQLFRVNQHALQMFIIQWLWTLMVLKPVFQVKYMSCVGQFEWRSQ